MRSNDPASGDPSLAAVRLWFETFTAQDIILLGYLFISSLLLMRFGSGDRLAHCAGTLQINFCTVVIVCYFARGNPALPRRARWLLYRLGLSATLLGNYLLLRDLLPAIRPDSVDRALLDLDLVLFRIEPALWLERFNRPAIVEWFAFFYFSYFFVCGAYLLGVIYLGRSSRAAHELALGTLIVFCVGQLGYLAVPASGPISFMAARFHGPVDGGFFWQCVTRTVAAGSAMKDVFPSLHTAVPTWFVWFAASQAKRDPRWRFAQWATLFVAANIVVSTMFLRWHYAVDVLAGLGLSTFAGLASRAIAAREERWRARNGLSPVWDCGATGRR